MPGVKGNSEIRADKRQSTDDAIDFVNHVQPEACGAKHSGYQS